MLFDWFGERAAVRRTQASLRTTFPVDLAGSYSIGVKEHSVTLCVRADYHTVTLTMDPDGVRRMVALLEASIRDLNDAKLDQEDNG